MSASPSPSPGEARLAEAIAAFEHIEPSPDLDDFCARHPDLDGLRAALETLLALRRVGPPPKPPDRLGPYRLLRELGRGGSAPVYLAVDERLQREVALKVLLAERGLGDRRARFLREGRALARVQHPNIVTIHDVGSQGDTCYLAMERLSGALQDVLDGPDPAGVEERRARAIRWALEAAEGLRAAHERGVLHRDLKPGNLLLGADGSVRVGDFGLARIEGDAPLTRTGEAFGTFAYAAPEQLAGATCTERSDVYALGATLHTMITGEVPAVGPGRVRTRWPDPTPRRLRRIVARATAESPEARFANMGAFISALEGCLRPRRAPRLLAALLLLGAGLAAGLLLDRPPAEVSEAVGTQTFPTGTAYPIWLGVAEDFAATQPLPGTFEGWWSQARAEAATTSEGTRVELAGHSLLGVTMSHGGARVAHFTTTPGELGLPRGTLGPWRLHPGSPDVDGDGLPESIVALGSAGTRRLLILKWEPQVWRRPALGWRVRADHRFSFGAPTVLDWDGDGGPEILVADEGRTLLDAQLTGRSTLYEVDVLTGRIDHRWVLRGAGRSTPRIARAGGLALYLDMEAEDELRSGRRLYRVAPGQAARVVPFPGGPQRALTWPVFHDVDGDGEAELLLGGHGGRFVAMRPDGEALWTHAGETPVESYPILSQQDADPQPEVCFMSTGRFSCLDANTGTLDWSVELSARARYRNQPTALSDTDGDGFEELVVGTSEGQILVLGRGGVLASAMAPEGARRAGGWPFYAGRPAVLADGSIMAATVRGWLMRWRVGDGLSLAWAHDLGVDITASLVPVGDGVLVADYAGRVRWLEADGRTQRWGFQAHDGVGGTPALTTLAGRPAAAFTDLRGHLYTVPIERVSTTSGPQSQLQ